jgi:hypothetical protein
MMDLARKAAACVVWSAAALFAHGAHAAEPGPASHKTFDGAALKPSDPSREQCLDAHRSAQELKQNGKLLEAQTHLQVCSSGSCPGVVITDCGNWIADLEQTTPSMTFEIRIDGKEAHDAKIFVDDQPVFDRAHAHRVNPGKHAVRVELPPFEPREETVVLAEGQRMRLISVEFSAKPTDPGPDVAPAPPPAKVFVRPTPGVVYPLVALGIAGLGSFGAFTYLGKQEQDELEGTCAPNCSDESMKSMKLWYAIGDISGGVGAAALLGATIVYFARPTREVDRVASTLSLGVGPVGLGASRIGSFGFSASRSW